MRIERFLLPVAAVMLLQYGCQKQDISQMPVAEDEYITTGDGSRLRSSALEQGHVRIELTDEMVTLAENDPDAFLELFRSIGVKTAERTFEHAGKFEERTRESGLHRWYDLYFDEEVPLTKAGEELSLIENLGYVEYRPKVHLVESQDVSWRSSGPSLHSNGESQTSVATQLFNDPMLAKQWHYYNDGSSYGSRSGCDINVVPVWKNRTTGRPDVIVAVVDGGIDYNHEDLAANMWHNPEKSGDLVYGYNFTNKSYLIEPSSHGTHVAGTISAVNNNGIGVSGIAGGDYANDIPGVKLMSCQMLTPSGVGYGSGAQAIKWGADNGAVISQNSWSNDGSSSVPKSERDAIDYFNQYAGLDENGNQVGPMKGGVVFFAAGNENSNYGSPASYSGCIAVASLAANYKRASYSNYGDWVDIAAPGGDNDTGPTIYSTLPDNTYGSYQGTSMACPHISGVAALIISAYGGPGFTREMLLERLLNNTTDLSKYGVKEVGGLVNAYAAIAGSSTVPPDQVTDISLSVASNKIHFKVKVPKDKDDGSPYGISLYYSKESFRTLENVESENYELGELVAGDYLEGDLDDLEFNTRYYIGFDAYDMSSNHGALSAVSPVTTLGNSDPVIECDVPVDQEVVVRTFETKVFNIKYNDPDGHALSVYFSDNSGGAAQKIDGRDNQCKIQISGKDAPEGHYEFTFTVTDKYGASSSITVPYVIRPNTPPVKFKDIDNLLFSGQNQTMDIDLAEYFHDEDGEVLNVRTVVSDNNVVNFAVTSSNHLFVTALGFGTADVTVTATDAMDMSVSSSFKVLVRNPSVPFDVYPNPVTDGKLYVRSGSQGSSEIVVSSASGAVIFSDTVQMDAFNPAMVDMSGCSSGVYTVRVSNSSESYKTTIVNIHND